MLLRIVSCRRCKLIFCICRSCCWRGQSYCSEKCRIDASRHAHREAQRRYRKSAKGRLAHRIAERRRRMRHAIKKNKKNVADGGSTVPLACCNMGLMKRSTGLITHKENTLKNMHKKARCLFCGHRGKIVIKFPRRGYGRRRKS